MSYNKIGLWAKGYLEALATENEISKHQLEVLIEKVRGMISSEEEKEDLNDITDAQNNNIPPMHSSTDDLPF